jgi:hypothetical protein
MPCVASPEADFSGETGRGVPPEVLAAYFGVFPPPVRRLSGGFSGAPVLLVGDPRPDAGWVLKSFPRGMSPGRARVIHAVMAAVGAAGLTAVPDLRSTGDEDADASGLDDRTGQTALWSTVVSDATGVLWEAAGWRPGRPVASPSSRQAEAAGRLLAAVHRALRPCGHRDERPAAAAIRVGDRVNPPGLVERLSRVRSLAGRGWSLRAEMALARRGFVDEEAADTAALVLRTAIDVERACGDARARLAAVAPLPMAMQWVLRDARSDHVLFVGDRVEGLVDWHAAGIDSPLGDLARLLGDWAIATGDREPAHRQDWWQACLEAYGGLDAAERGQIRLLHEAGLFGALDNWFTWVIEERRRFSDWPAVTHRVSAIGRCLAGLE